MPRIYPDFIDGVPKRFNSPEHAVTYMRRKQPEAMTIDLASGQHRVLNSVRWSAHVSSALTYLSDLHLLKRSGAGDYLIKDVSL